MKIFQINMCYIFSFLLCCLKVHWNNSEEILNDFEIQVLSFYLSI